MKLKNSDILSNLQRFFFAGAFLVLLAGSIFFAYAIKVAELKAGVLILIALVAGPATFGIVAYPRFGILVLLVAAYLLQFIIRMGLTTFPLGTVMDGLEALLILGLFINQKYNPDWSFLKSPVSIIIIVWIAYNVLEVINPDATSKMAWLYTIRSLAVVMLTYFIFNYHIRSLEYVRIIIKMWIGLSIFGALMGFKQQYIGFFGYEEAYLNSDPLIKDLLFIGGEWRKFSIYSDPVAFSYNMIVSALLCTGLMFAPLATYKKWILGFLIFCFLSNMLYAGTRSAYILIPASMAMLMIVVFNKKIFIVAAVFGLFMAALIFVPTSNVSLYRFQSAFKPSTDASFNTRAENQRIIKPYIRSHPMGGGLGSTGVWGVRFSPGTFLSTFPPDSGYVRVAVELGWIGLLIFCTLIFVILKTGIENYYAMKDPELKSYCLAMVLIIFALHIGNYPQEAITQYPLNIYFFLVAALINITYKLDKEKSEKGVIDTKSNIDNKKYGQYR